MAIKETCNHSAGSWRDPKNWRGQLPREIKIHQLVEERRAVDSDMCRNLIHCRGHRLSMRKRKYRLYLDYCSGGDLRNAMASHSRTWEPAVEDNDDFPCLPEAFIWTAVKALATACLVLQNGTTVLEPIQNWKSITHLDIQLPNVLLGRRKYTGSSNSHDQSGMEKPKTLQERRDKEKQSLTNKSPVCLRISNNDRGAHANTRVQQDLPMDLVLTDFGLSFYSLYDAHCPISDNPEDYLLERDHGRYPPVSTFYL